MLSGMKPDLAMTARVPPQAVPLFGVTVVTCGVAAT
jgi:hypothetical protein